MALTNCPECNKPISNKAHSCPNCGFPMVDEIAKTPIIQTPKKNFLNTEKRKKNKTTPTTGFFFRLDQDLLSRLNDQAKRMNTSRSVLIRMGIVKILEEMELTVTKETMRR